MADQIKNKDIFDPKVFIKEAKDAIELKKALDLIEASMKRLVKLSAKAFEGLKFENAKDVKAFTENIQKSAKAISNLDKFEKKRLATLEKLDEANSDRVQSLVEVQEQLKLQNKANRDLVNSNAKIVGSFKALTTQVNKLKKEYKDAVARAGGFTDKTEKLRKEVIKADRELKDITRSMSDYGDEVEDAEDKTEDAADSLLEFAKGAAIAATALAILNKAVESSQEGSEDLRVVTAQIEAGTTNIASGLFTTGKAFFDLFKETAKGNKTLKEFVTEFTRAQLTINDVGDGLGKAVDAAGEAELANIALEKASRALREEVARLNGEIEEQNIIAGDSTQSFDAITAAARRATQLQVDRARILRQIGQEELDIITQRIESLGEGVNTLALENEQSEKKIQLIELQNELTAATLDNEKLLRETTRDRFEQELDFAIDFFDNTKTLLERQIADENIAFETRAGNLARLQVLAESSFQSQIDLVNAQVGQDINLRELVEIDDERLVRQKLITDFTITDEITLLRILEVLRERKTVTQDVADAEREVTDALNESVLETQTLVNELDQLLKQGQIDATEDFDNNLALRRVAIEDQADFEILLAEDNADQILVIQAQLNNDIAALDREALKEKQRIADENKKIREDERDEAIELANQIVDATLDALQEQSDARLDQLDSEIERREASIERMSARSEGQITEGIAFEEAQLEKARLKQQQEEEKAAKRARLIAIAQTFLNQLANSEEEGAAAIAKALAVALGGGVIAETIIGAAYEGTEDTGEGKGMDSKNGMTWMLHPHERVMSENQNQRVGTMSNEDLANLAYDYQNGSLENRWAFMPRVAGISSEEKSTKAIIQSNKDVIQSIKDNRVSIIVEANSFSEQMFKVVQTTKVGKSTEIMNHVWEPLKSIS